MEYYHIMTKWLKYAIIVLVGVSLFIIAVPFLLNWLLLRERQFDIVGEAIDWLQFWPVYLSAIGTIAMTIVTFCALRANQKQMASMIESEGAQLVFSLYSDWEYVLLKVTNVGRSVARNIQLNIPNRFEIIERNAGIPFGEGLINHFNNLTPIPLLLPNQSDYIPLYMYRVLGESIKDNEGIKTVEEFGDSYSPDAIIEIAEYLKSQSFTITGHFINFLNQKHLVSQEVDNSYNVTLDHEKNSAERMFKDLNRNLAGIKSELHSSGFSKLKDIDADLDRVRTELHSIGENLKKIEGKIKK